MSWGLKMNQKISVMKRLNDKFRILKANKLFDAKELNKRAAKDGYSWRNEGVRSEIKDDYILILNIIDANENIAIAVNYQGRTDDEVSIIASKANTKRVFQEHNSYNKSEDVMYSESYSYEAFSENLRLFIRKLPELTKSNVAEVFSKMMNIYDPNLLSEEEKEIRKKAAKKKLKELYKKEDTIKENLSAAQKKARNAQNKLNKKISEMPEFKELQELEQRVKVLREIIYKARHEERDQTNGIPALLREVEKIEKEYSSHKDQISSQESIVRKCFTEDEFLKIVDLSRN